MFKFVFLLLAAFACFASAQYGNTNYEMFDANGFPTQEAITKHGPYILGVSAPGNMLLLNITMMHNHEPGVTTYEDYDHTYTYQVNGVEKVDNRWRMTHHQFIKRLPKVWAYGKWVDDVNNEQLATPPYPGAGNEKLFQSYNIRAIEPIMFEYLGASVLKMKARLLSQFSYEASYNLPISSTVELNVMDEIVSVTAKTINNLFQGIFTGKEFYYSINVYQGTHNLFPDWGYGFRPEFECAGTTGDKAEACECYQRMLNGQLTIENDPLAAAAGYYHEVYICDLNESSSPSKRNAIDEVRWPSHPLATASYNTAFYFDASYTEQPMRYVPGMPVSREQHNAKFFGTEQQ